jgi:hypothetical protein
MKFDKVKSSMLSEVAYDSAGHRLHIKFPNGKEYVYRDVAPSLHADMMEAESIGKFFGKHVRGKFSHSVVEPEKS